MTVEELGEDNGKKESVKNKSKGDIFIEDLDVIIDDPSPPAGTKLKVQLLEKKESDDEAESEDGVLKINAYKEKVEDDCIMTKLFNIFFFWL